MGAVTTKDAAVSVASGMVAGEVLVGVRKPAPTPTPVATRGAAVGLEDIAGGEYAANMGNTVHLSQPAKMDRWCLRHQRACGDCHRWRKNQISGIPPFLLLRVLPLDVMG